MYTKDNSVTTGFLTMKVCKIPMLKKDNLVWEKDDTKECEFYFYLFKQLILNYAVNFI